MMTLKVYDLSNWMNWNECTEVMEGREVWGLEDKMNWDTQSLDAFRHSCEAMEEVVRYIGPGLRDKVWTRDTDSGKSLVYE